MKEDLVVTLEYKKPSPIVRFILWFFGIILVLIIAGFAYLVFKANQLTNQFANGAGLSKEEVLNTASAATNQLENDLNNLANLKHKYNFLVLGTDALAGRDGDPALTDTMLLAQVDFSDGKVKTLSLPRDLYIEDYKTKINALYYYGQDRYPDSPETFPKEVIESMGDISIDHTIVIGIEDLEKLIDIAGGIQIDVPTAFTDDEFPVQDVDVSKVTDPKLLYETVTFEAGPQTMDSKRALQYMRSRHSGDDEGTDIARSARQQLVLQALFQKMLSLRDPQTFGKLYRFYLDDFAKSISMETIVDILAVYIDYANQNNSFELTFEPHQLSIYPDDENGLIFNPPLWQSNQQWIYQIRDQAKLTESIHEIFN